MNKKNGTQEKDVPRIQDDGYLGLGEKGSAT